MATTRVDLILHPVRMQIIMEMANRQLTPQQLSEALPDVPQATLYRHLAKLARGEILVVVEERPVRGTVEKVYALSGAAQVGPAELARASREELMRYFTSFVVSLLGEFSRYLKQDKIDLFQDGVSFNQAPFYLTQQELIEMVSEMQPILVKRLFNKPAPGRRRMVLTTVLIPDLANPEGRASPAP